jgi:preprotein translocase subunit SecE
MGREARRAQARQERRQRQQKAQTRTRPPAIATSTGSELGRGGGSLLKPRWATDIISELRKVTWPSRQEVMHLTLVVIVVALTIGMILGAADLAFGWFIEHVVLPQR